MENQHRQPNRVSRFLSSEKGERFFNFAYSIGAAIVICGVLFHILHLKWGNLLLAVGLGTEIAMFVLMAFDTGHSDHGHGEGAHPSRAHEIPETQQATHESSVPAVTEQPSGPVPALTSDLATAVETLGRNVAALNALYEIQLKSTAGHVEGVEGVGKSIRDLRDIYARSAEQSALYCRETEKMTHYVVQLNAVYKKMIDAMSTGFSQQGAPTAFDGAEDRKKEK